MGKTLEIISNDMKRETLFRGKTINGDIVEGNLAYLPKDRKKIKRGYYISNSVGSPFAFQVRPESVFPYIGNKDDNGKRIYESDKVKLTTIIDGDEFTGYIDYEDGAYIIRTLKEDGEVDKDYILFHDAVKAFIIEVI